MLTSYVLEYKLVGFNLPLAENWLVALRFHIVFLTNARKWEPLTDFSRIDRRYDLIVTKKSVDLSHQRYKIKKLSLKIVFCIFFFIFLIFRYEYGYGTWNTIFSVVFNFRFVFNI